MQREGTRVWSSECVDGGTGRAVLGSLAFGRKGRIRRSSKEDRPVGQEEKQESVCQEQ